MAPFCGEDPTCENFEWALSAWVWGGFTLQQSDSVERIAVCDADSKRGDAAKTAHSKVAGIYAELAQMLGTERLDAVSVVTPDHLHRQHVEICLAAGCHVLLTKPLATNLEDGRAIVRAAEASGRKFMVAHERRFQSATRAVKDLLDARKLGEIIYLRLDEFHDKREHFQRSPWYASAETGRTAMVGTGIHQVDLLRHWIGRKIESVTAFGNAIGELQFPGDKTTAALFKFEGGAVGQVTVSYEARHPAAGKMEEPILMLSTKGMVKGNCWGTNDADNPRWFELPVDEQPVRAGTFNCIHSFIHAVATDGPVAVDGRDAFASLAASVAADESAKTGKPAAPATY